MPALESGDKGGDLGFQTKGEAYVADPLLERILAV